MTIQLSTAVRNARLDAIEAAIGAAAVMKIRTGAAPANCAGADTGTVLATLALPNDYMAAAANGAKTLLGAWADNAADAAGVAAHFRIYAADGVTCHLQGTIAKTGNAGDLILDNTAFEVGQGFTVSAFTLSEPA